MRESPHSFSVDLLRRPLRVLSPYDVEHKLPRVRPHAVGDRQPLARRLRAQHRRHLIVDDFKIPGYNNVRHGPSSAIGFTHYITSGQSPQGHACAPNIPLHVAADWLGRNTTIVDKPYQQTIKEHVDRTLQHLSARAGNNPEEAEAEVDESAGTLDLAGSRSGR